jgi:coenzyme F420-reducing hydrogenase delta subunit
MRLQYPPDIRIIQVPCTGKVDIIHLLMAFEEGADGVLVAGCLEGDCHFREGNLHAKRRVKRVKEILDTVGLGGDRVEMYNLSAGQGGRFAEIAQEMTARILALGPSPIRIAKGLISRPGVKAAGVRGEVVA